MAELTFLDRYKVWDGVSYPVTLRATLNRNAEGLVSEGSIMWSADLEIISDSSFSITAAGNTPEEALSKLSENALKDVDTWVDDE